MTRTVITVENLSKSYLVGHRTAVGRGYVALRDVLAREARNFTRKAIDVVRGRQVVQGDAIEEFWALNNVSFELKQGEVLGLIGRNGAGKSTLLKILSRITEPTAGRVSLRGRVSSLLEVGTGFHSELSGRENIFLNGAILGMSRREIKRKFDEIVAFSGVEKFLDTPVKHYSSGMYVRLAFAVAAYLESEILIVDEVLAVGDVEFQKKCIGQLNNIAGKDGRTVLFVSHNMDAVRRVCSRALLLNNGAIDGDGDSSSVISQYLVSKSSARAEWSQPISWSPKSGAGFSGFSICDQQGPKSSFLFGQDFCIRLKLRNTTGQSIRAVVGIEFSTDDGAALMTTHSNDCGNNTSLPPGDSEVTCYVKPNPLMPGRYSFRLGLVDYTWSLLDFVESPAFIEILEVPVSADQISSRRPGRLVLPLEWSEVSEDGAAKAS